MKKIKYVILLLLLCAIKFGQSQTMSDTLKVYPNPFPGIATIYFEIANKDTVTLEVYDMLGELKQTYFSNAILPSGAYTIVLQGDTLPNGLYVIRLQYAYNKTKTVKAIKQGTTTAINEPIELRNILYMYPNPTNDILTITMDGQKTILISSLQGQEVKKVVTDKQTISLSDLPAACYIVHVFDADNLPLTTKQIIVIK